MISEDKLQIYWKLATFPPQNETFSSVTPFRIIASTTPNVKYSNYFSGNSIYTMSIILFSVDNIYDVIMNVYRSLLLEYFVPRIPKKYLLGLSYTYLLMNI